VIVIPAIDLKEGRCVRLAQGDFERVTVYDEDPVAVAKRWQEAGAERIHIVDLDGSLAGYPRNHEAVAAIVRALSIPVEVGGGIRDLDTVEDYLSAGVQWVVLGTAAIRDEAFFTAACRHYPSRILLGLDAVKGCVSVQGWTEHTTLTAIEVAQRYVDIGVGAIIYTDVERDGMGTGVNISQTLALAKAVPIPIIASGGVASLEDLRQLMALQQENIMGVIIGRALYNGAISLWEAVRLTKTEALGVGGNG